MFVLVLLISSSCKLGMFASLVALLLVLSSPTFGLV